MKIFLLVVKLSLIKNKLFITEVVLKEQIFTTYSPNKVCGKWKWTAINFNSNYFRKVSLLTKEKCINTVVSCYSQINTQIDATINPKIYCFIVQTLLNMFRVLQCPSSGARQTAVAASGFRMNVEVEVFLADHFSSLLVI